MPIAVLSPEVVSKIAAGEVIERPASVVKELIENSLDAKATQISVETRGGGVNRIKVTDNGAGISPSDVDLAFQRYATSKISSLEDLDSILSLGFRGEALPSVAAVAQVEVLTRTPEELAGTYLCLTDGVVTRKEQRACPQGTVVAVRHLFQKVPARLKFLKSPNTENSHISHLVMQYSLACPEVRFSLVLDGNTVIQTSGNGELCDALVSIYGIKTAEAMLPVGEEDSSVRGFVSPPSVNRASRNYLNFFINRRWVRSGLLSRATIEAYHGMLMSGKYPIAVLNMQLLPQDVDVNVHPAKAEVKFRDEQTLFIVVQRAVRAALVSEATAPQVRRQFKPADASSSASVKRIGAKQEELFAGGVSKQVKESVGVMDLHGVSLPILRVFGQLAATYIIAEGPDGLYLIDQHAAHERILFERVRAQRASMTVEVQGMLEPLTIEVAPHQEETLRDYGDILESYGFAIEPFGARTYLLRTAPSVLQAGNIAQTVLEILDSIGEEREPSTREDKVISSLACHGSVRAGQVLKPDEIGRLIQDLERTESPLTCPHGRPTMIRFSAAQLEREFGRSL
jgi:DNA mismatch repair protein MutL